MAVFFLVVGLEVKREFLQGELRDRRRAVLPIVAAIGGMAVPALIYAFVNVGGEGASGWGIPMATDIAFALGVLAIVAPRLPGSLRVFLLALAIVDDIGAIVVIAIFYSSSIDVLWLAVAGGVVASIFIIRRAGVSVPWVFVVLGVILWLAVHASGIHATIAGVVLGLLVPATPDLDREIVESSADELLDVFTPTSARETTRLARRAVSELEWIEHSLHPISSLAIVPLFALANAGVAFGGNDLAEAASSPVTLGIVLGLVVGKTLGIAGAVWLATKLGVADVAGATARQVVGVAMLAGIGFTVSLFIADLAFDADRLVAQAKVGIFLASVVASVGGALVLRSPRRSEP
jgi:NhaA family Na+:H+ antiporter